MMGFGTIFSALYCILSFFYIFIYRFDRIKSIYYLDNLNDYITNLFYNFIWAISIIALLVILYCYIRTTLFYKREFTFKTFTHFLHSFFYSIYLYWFESFRYDEFQDISPLLTHMYNIYNKGHKRFLAKFIRKFSALADELLYVTEVRSIYRYLKPLVLLPMCLVWLGRFHRKQRFGLFVIFSYILYITLFLYASNIHILFCPKFIIMFLYKGYGQHETILFTLFLAFVFSVVILLIIAIMVEHNENLIEERKEWNDDNDFDSMD